VIDAHDLPVTHVTRRTGRPFTEAIQRNLWRRDLHWLAETAPAFEAQPTRV
jgi:hypothetical protein